MSLARSSSLLLALLVMSCASPPANVAGSYTINLTNDTNECMFMNWDGMSTTGIPFEVTQSGTSITGSVGAGAAVSLDILFGAHVFTGSVSGNHLDMVLHGTNATMVSTCRLTLDAHAEATLVGDALTDGRITYTYATNADPTCPIYTQTCSSVQRMNGARPPGI